MVGCDVGKLVGNELGCDVGKLDGIMVGCDDGMLEGCPEGLLLDGSLVGLLEG